MTKNKITMTFAREVGSLDQIFTFLEQIGQSRYFADNILYSFKLCLEELFVNMIKHQPQSKHPVTLELELSQGKTILRLIDRDVDYFDVTRPPQVDTRAPIEQRKPGGLGLFLVHQLMDEVLYDYKNRTSTITLIKNL